MAKRRVKSGGAGLGSRFGLQMLATMLVVNGGMALFAFVFLKNRFEGPDMQTALFVVFASLGVSALLGALVAYLNGQSAGNAINRLVNDVRTIARGNLSHRTHASAIGEVSSLGRTIDRMAAELKEAQEAHLELSTRERELELAGEVREALLPLATPYVEGFDIGGIHLASAELSGDFHDYVEREDGTVFLLVCDVSGEGVPAALVAGTVRAYLRSELAASDDLGEALKRVNRWMADDVRRGMYATVFVIQIAAGSGHAVVACAGHKLPLLRYTKREGSLRVVHPQGIALGFDRGPVFDRRLAVERIEFEPGDRLLIGTASAVTIEGPDGDELGEDAFFRRFLRRAALETNACLKGLRRDLMEYADQDELARNVSLTTVLRD